jgi:hypothetical protein
MLLALVPTMLLAGREVHKAHRSGEIRIDNVSATKELRIRYSNGDVDLLFWNKDYILLKYEETAAASTKKEAEDFLNQRDLKQSANDEAHSLSIGQISVVDRYNVSAESKWTLYVPIKQKSVYVANFFGNISVGEGYDKQIRAEVKQGDFHMTNTKAMCMVIVERGNFSIGEAGYLNLNARYANGTVGFANVLNLDCDHAQSIMIDKVQDLNLHKGTHSKVKVSGLNYARITGTYLDVDVAEVHETAEIADLRHSSVSMSKINKRCEFRGVNYCQINVKVSKTNCEPRILVPDASFSDIVVSIPKTLKVSCLLRSNYGKTEFDVPSSMKQHVVENTMDYSQTRMHTLLNTTTFTPSSVIDIKNSRGNIIIKGY